MLPAAVCPAATRRAPGDTGRMNRIVIPAVAAGFAAAAALVMSPPAALADSPLLNGTYAIDGGDENLVATVASNCGAEGCTASVASNVGWTSTATMTGGRWNFTVTKPDGEVCADGSYAPVRIAYSIDPATLTGTVTADANGDCPGGQVTQAAFRLRKIG